MKTFFLFRSEKDCSLYEWLYLQELDPAVKEVRVFLGVRPGSWRSVSRGLLTLPASAPFPFIFLFPQTYHCSLSAFVWLCREIIWGWGDGLMSEVWSLQPTFEGENQEVPTPHEYTNTCTHTIVIEVTLLPMCQILTVMAVQHFDTPTFDCRCSQPSATWNPTNLRPPWKALPSRNPI